MPDPVESIVLVTSAGSESGNRLAICIDYQLQLETFLNEWLPSEDVLFSRWLGPDRVNPLACGNAPDYLRLPYPPLPPIRIGQLQWPTGASRYGRALYAVDWVTMRDIAVECWGYEPPMELIDPDGDPEDPNNMQEVIPEDVPEEWGTASATPITVRIKGTDTSPFTASMYVLPPYRVPGLGADLWLLPLVDIRFLWLHAVHESSDTEPESWEQLLTDLADEMGTTLAQDAVDAYYGDPNPRLYRTQQPQPASILLDAAALSVGLRIVLEPATGTLRAINRANSETRRKHRLGYMLNSDTNEYEGESSALLIAGGTKGIGALPEYLDVYCQDGDSISKKSSAIVGGNVGYIRLPVWTTWDIDGDDTAAQDFVNKLAADIAAWANSGGQYTFVGPVEEPQVNGYDDYFSIDLFELQSEKYTFRTRFYELPAVFLPAVVLAGGTGIDCGGGQIIEYVIDSLRVADAEVEDEAPYAGLTIASVTIKGAACGKGQVETEVDVVDHSGCIFDEEDMTGYTGWAASSMEYLSLDPEADPGEFAPCHYAAFNRCCAPDSGTYATPPE